ncbi:MAG: amino acid permease [Vampirovibrionales bacterium]|nr:amino acid permease [Vampirovibrionales bacterium]
MPVPTLKPPAAESGSKSLMQSMFQPRPIEDLLAEQAANESASAQQPALKRSLGAFDLVIFGIGAMIGAGVFVITGAAAVGSATQVGAGPAILLSFVMTAIISGFCALCFAELAAMLPLSGSSFSYALATMGELPAWLVAWALVLEYAVGNMAVVVGWTGTLKAFLQQTFNIALPDWMTRNTLDTVSALSDVPASGVLNVLPFKLPFVAQQYYLLVQAGFNLPGILIMIAATWLLVLGISESARMATAMVLTKAGVILLFAAVGLYYLFNGHMDVWAQNWFSGGWQTFAPGGFKGILGGAALIFFAYIGFDAVSTVAEESKNPQRDLPIGIAGALAVCTVLYCLVAIAVTAITPLNQINVSAPVMGTLQALGYPWAVWVIGLGTLVALTSVLLVFQLGTVRVFYAVARDGFFPKSWAKIHPKFATPHVATIAAGVLVAVGGALLPINLLAEMCNLGTLAIYAVVCAAVLILRKTQPSRHRPFTVPFGPVIPWLGILGCAVMSAGLGALCWVLTLAWFAIGVGIYAVRLINATK